VRGSRLERLLSWRSPAAIEVHLLQLSGSYGFGASGQSRGCSRGVGFCRSPQFHARRALYAVAACLPRLLRPNFYMIHPEPVLKLDHEAMRRVASELVHALSDAALAEILATAAPALCDQIRAAAARLGRRV